MKTKQNWFPTLLAALESEKLVGKIRRDEEIRPGTSYCTTIDNDRRTVSIYRNKLGLYERPVHYAN